MQAEKEMEMAANKKCAAAKKSPKKEVDAVVFKKKVRKVLDDAKTKGIGKLTRKESQGYLRKIDGLLKGEELTEEQPEVLMRFTRLEELFRMFELGGIPIYGTDRWDDVCDRELVDRGCKEFKQRNCGVMCFMKSIAEEGNIRETSAHWGIYSRNVNVDVPSELLGLGVRIDFYKKKLIAAVNADNKNGIRFCDSVKYVPFDGEKETIKTCSGKKWFFVKRNAFSWENEFRVVVMGQKVDQEKREYGAKAFVKADLSKVIQRVVFSPYCKTSVFSIERPSTQTIYNCVLDVWNQRRKEYRESGRSCQLGGIIEVLGKSYRSRILDSAAILELIERPKGS